MRRATTAATAPSSRTSRPSGIVAWRSHSNRLAVRRPCGWNSVPTSLPASAAAMSPAAQISAHAPAAAASSGRGDLRGHPPGPDAGPAGTAQRHLGEVGVAADIVDLAGRAAAGVGVEDARDVGEQHEQVGRNQVRGQRSEPVVVPEPDLVGGHRVVLVHDRDDTQVQQPVERAPRVAVVRAAHHVLGGEQHLPDAQVRAGERPAVALDQQRPAPPTPLPAAWPGRAGGGPGAAARDRQRSRRRRPGRSRSAVLRRAASASTSASTRSPSRPPSGEAREDEPTLTTIRRAVSTQARVTAAPPRRRRRFRWRRAAGGGAPAPAERPTPSDRAPARPRPASPGPSRS